MSSEGSDTKRSRRECSQPLTCTATAPNGHQEVDCGIFGLPAEVMLSNILSRLDVRTLAWLATTCKYFGAKTWLPGGEAPAMSLVDRAAQDQVLEACKGPDKFVRGMPWITRLWVERTGTPFDARACDRSIYFEQPEGAPSRFKLHGVGPRLLTSSLTTAQAPLLRWKLRLTGNCCCEFGLVPVELEEENCLHKCSRNEYRDTPVGFASSITVGSKLPVKLPFMKNSVVELCVWRGILDILVQNPESGRILVWQGQTTASKPYEGPLEMRLSFPYQFKSPARLAITLWANGAFEILHPHDTLPQGIPPPAGILNLDGQPPINPQQVVANAAGNGAAAMQAAAAAMQEAAAQAPVQEAAAQQAPASNPGPGAVHGSPAGSDRS